MKNIRERTVSKKKRQRVTFFACFAAALFFYAGGITAFADAQGTVIPPSAKVRSGADTASDAVSSVKQNDKVTITGKTTGADGQTWYQITDGNTKGFIRADLVNVAGEVAGEAGGPTITNTDAEVSPADISAGTINSASVNIRKGPAPSDAVVANAKQGTELSITGQATGADGKVWYQVSLSSGGGTVTGFVRSDLVEPSSGGAQTENGAGDGTEGTAAAPEGEAETGTEGGADQAAGGEPSSDSYTKLNNVVSSRILPEGTDLSDMQIDQAKLAEWESGQYYVLYTNSSDGSDQWYLYDTSQGSCMKIANPTVTDSGEGGSDGFGKNTKIILIVMAAVILALVITVTVLILKLRDAGLDDEEDEDEEEDDEEDDDEEDDEEDEDSGRSGRVNSRAWRPRNFLHATDDEDEDEEDDDDDDEDDEEDEEEPVRPVRRRKSQPVRKPAPKPQPKQQAARRPAKEEPRQTQKTKKPAPKPAYYEDDEDDEFEFEFLNMDGKDDFS